jgi:hypothetical protein
MDFSILKGLDLVRLGRTTDMLWISIGEPLTITSRRTGQKRVVNQYAFHVQCPWLFLQNKKILLGLNDIYDIYAPANSALASDIHWDWDVFEGEQSIFNKVVNMLNETLLPLTVIDVATFDNGNLVIMFDKETVFELFVPGSAEREYWRFIDFEKDLHYVVYEK